MRARGNIWALALGLMVAFYSLAPFAWLLLTSFKSQLSVTAIPPTLWPEFRLDFYRSALVRYDILHFAANSLLVAGATTAITIVLASGAGYVLGRASFRLKPWVLGAILMVGMFPQVSLAGPVWRILRGLGWLNTYQGLVAPYVALTLPLAVWILACFFQDLPAELEEAAMVDGCGRAGALWRVILPLAAPGVFTAAILVFIYAWNEFFFALLIMTDRAGQTLPVGIALFQGQYTMPWGEIAAASTCATLPLAAAVFLFQRRIVDGLSAGALKG